MDTETLTPVDELAFKASKPYPGDSPEYRTARTALLAEEIELRRQIERVAALRRALPPGGEARDYRFTDEHGTELGLADLFGRHDTLVSYFWMYGPERERPCPMCTSFLSSFRVVRHFWGGEMGMETADPGQDPRGAPDPDPLWTILDLTPGGRGSDWRPKLEYS